MAHIGGRFWLCVFFVVLFGLFARLAWCADINFRGTLPTRDAERVWIFFDVTTLGQTVPYSYVAPAGLTDQQYQTWLDRRLPKFEMDILTELYPDAPKALKRRGPAIFKAWIANGAILRHCYRPNQDEDVICSEYQAKRQDLSGRDHPKRLTIKQQYEAATTLAEKLQILSEYVFNGGQ